MVSGSSTAYRESIRRFGKEMTSNEADMLKVVRVVVRAAGLLLESRTGNPMPSGLCIDSVLNERGLSGSRFA